MSAVCVERPAVLVQELTEVETRYNNMLTAMEHERSLLSDHEMRHHSDMYV